MARKASIEKNNRRKAAAAKFQKLRVELKAKALNSKLTDE